MSTRQSVHCHFYTHVGSTINLHQDGMVTKDMIVLCMIPMDESNGVRSKTGNEP